MSPGGLRQVGLEGCSIIRPEAFGGAVEVVVAGVGRRSFPARVTSGLEVCLKLGGSPHEVRVNGHRRLFPADSFSVTPPGCVWACESDDAFASIDVPSSLLGGAASWGSEMQFAARGALPGFLRLVRALTTDPDAVAAEEGLTDLIERLRGAGALRLARGNLPPGPIERARAYLEAHLHRRVSLDELAVASGADKFQLVRGFRRRFGITPSALHLRLRVEASRADLVRGHNIASVAAEYGFADQSHYGRVFHRIVGLWPSRYAGRRSPRPQRDLPDARTRVPTLGEATGRR
jgi:AraC-like DNA-binding protein